MIHMDYDGDCRIFAKRFNNHRKHTVSKVRTAIAKNPFNIFRTIPRRGASILESLNEFEK